MSRFYVLTFLKFLFERFYICGLDCEELLCLYTLLYFSLTTRARVCQLVSAERRLSDLESCECRRQCRGPTPDGAPFYRDGDLVSQPDPCTHCICRVRV